MYTDGHQKLFYAVLVRSIISVSFNTIYEIILSFIDCYCIGVHNTLLPGVTTRYIDIGFVIKTACIEAPSVVS